MRFTKELRQQIIEHHARKHNGVFVPEKFLDEVRAEGSEHPAYEWFEWDEQKAATAYNLEQARDFARGLKVTFSVETVGRNQPLKIVERSVPAYMSPAANRRDGGGYIFSDPNDGDHRVELCIQAARDLKAWMRRYEAVFVYIGADQALIEKLVMKIDAGPVKSKAIESAA